MDYQQSELEDLKLKFQESDAARENQRGEIESLKKQGEKAMLWSPESCFGFSVNMLWSYLSFLF